MEKYVELKKQQKKAQKAYYQKNRIGWGEVNPRTRVVESKKRYDRNREKAAIRQEL